MAPVKGSGHEAPSSIGKLYALFACGLLAFLALLYVLEQQSTPPLYVLLTCVLVPVASFVLIAAASRTSDPLAFAVAGRSVPALWNGMAAGASSLPASFLFGSVGALFLMGYDGLPYLLGVTGGFALAAVLVAPRLRRSGAETVPGYFGMRFGAPARVMAAIILVVCSLTLLVAEISFAGLVAAHGLGVAFEWMVLASLVVVLACTLPGGMQGLTRSQIAQYAVLAVAFLVPLFFVSAKTHGLALPQIAYGEALGEIAGLEKSMLLGGLADARTLKPHAKPFLQLDTVNFVGLTLCLMAGAASLPHILTRHLAVRSAGEARFSGAWSLFFVFLILVSAPAYAAYAKLEVYSLIARGTQVTALPPWIESASRNDALRIHGVSLELLDDVIAARRAGATDVAGVAAYLKQMAPAMLPAWSDLKVPARTALLDAAGSLRDANDAERWSAFQRTVLPAAGRAAGNKTGLLTHGALTLEPMSLVFSIPAMTGAPIVIAGLLIAGALAAAMATASGLLLTIACALGHDVMRGHPGSVAPPARRVAMTRALLVLMAAVAALTAALSPPDPVAAMTSAFSLAAAGLFPALVLGLWWRRANAWGAVAGMGLGLGLCLAYLVGTRYFAVDFYEAWSHLSNAGEAAAGKFASLEAAWMSAAGGDAKAEAWAALEAHARGTPLRTGVANWFGVHNASAAIFGLPAGVLVIVLLSLVTPAPRPDARAVN